MLPTWRERLGTHTNMHLLYEIPFYIYFDTPSQVLKVARAILVILRYDDRKASCEKTCLPRYLSYMLTSLVKSLLLDCGLGVSCLSY
jgi:hypothetical protein